MTELLGSLFAPSPLAVLLVALVGAPVTMLLGWRRPRVAAIVAVVASLLACAMLIAAWNAGGSDQTLPWVPSWGLKFSLTFDGISAVYGLLATGIGAAVLVYSSGYLPRHLHHQHRDPSEAITFYGLILLFMGAMVGLVMADDLFLLFLFWDLTAVTSYFLIGFDRDEPASRPAALMALAVTGGTAILMLVGIMVLWLVTGTSSIAELASRQIDTTTLSVAVGLIAIAALAKSAQVPLHFWLPRAMVAPTPVSSYLHSAAMVAAGVFLLARIMPLIHRASLLPQTLVAVGLASIAVGGFLAIGKDDMKRVLAYSTIGQYGYVVAMLGLGGKSGAIGAAFYVIAHGLAKCALFLTAGAVAEATGKKRLSEVGGLFRAMPALGIASGIAAATVAGLPLTIGFFKDELFYDAMHEHGTAMTVAAVLAAGLTFAYMGRFWWSIFGGRPRVDVQPLPAVMVGPVVFLAAVSLLGGIWVGPENDLANAGGSASLMEPVSTSLAYHIDLRPVNVMALAAYGLGVALLATIAWWSAASRWAAAITEHIGPDAFYRRSIEWANAFSDRLYGYEVHDLRGRIVSVLMPVGVLVLLGLIFTSNEGAFLIGAVTRADLLIALVLVVACGAALTATQITQHLPAVILLSAVGFPLAAVYAFLGAPDVALVAVLMETMLSLLFIGFLSAMRDRPSFTGFESESSPALRRRDRVIGLAATLAAFITAWGVLSKPAPVETAARDQIALTPSAHAKDVVTAILSDFRGLDTMGEITVIGITMIGLLTLLQRPAQKRPRS